MILVIRGHLRNAFDNTNFYNLINDIYKMNPDLKIFIHTWNVYSCSTSWRKIQENNTLVTKMVIYNYFNDLKHLIKHIMIDDDTKIELIGNLNGKIKYTLMPIIGWKNYWYGKYKIIEYIHNNEYNRNETLVNLRFDILSNSNSFLKGQLLDFIRNNIGITFSKNNFIFSEQHRGIDNIYIGNVDTMYKLSKYFFIV